MDGRAKAQAVNDHLGEAAKEEVLCRDANVRENYGRLVEVLKSLFGPLESIPSLRVTFTSIFKWKPILADFSHRLMSWRRMH